MVAEIRFLRDIITITTWLRGVITWSSDSAELASRFLPHKLSNHSGYQSQHYIYGGIKEYVIHSDVPYSMWCSFLINVSWCTQLNAFVKSQKRPRASCNFSQAFKICDTNSTPALVSDLPRVNPNCLPCSRSLPLTCLSNWCKISLSKSLLYVGSTDLV